MKICFDLDGTLCNELPTFEKSMAIPLPGAVRFVNIRYETGDFVMIYTGRGWAEYPMTKKWLDDNGFKYHVLLCGKPIYDELYDDRAKQLNWINNG